MRAPSDRLTPIVDGAGADRPVGPGFAISARPGEGLDGGGSTLVDPGELGQGLSPAAGYAPGYDQALIDQTDADPFAGFVGPRVTTAVTSAHGMNRRSGRWNWLTCRPSAVTTVGGVNVVYGDDQRQIDRGDHEVGVAGGDDHPRHGRKHRRRHPRPPREPAVAERRLPGERIQGHLPEWVPGVDPADRVPRQLPHHHATGLTLSIGPDNTGPTTTEHADFMNGWNQSILTADINACTATSTNCGQVHGASATPKGGRTQTQRASHKANATNTAKHPRHG